MGINLIQYLLIATIVFRVNSEKPSGNITAVTQYSKINQRSLDDCTPGRVFELTPEIFYDTTEKGIFFVKFYDPNCIDCHDFESIWTDLAQSFKSKRNICFAELNCVFAKVLCNDYELRYEPNLIWFENGYKVRQYDGDLTFDDVHKFVIQMNRWNQTLSSGSQNINSHTPWIFAFMRNVIISLW
ncbi:thioredoxin domain-containing protein 5 [Drosophila elegans]|uniref:thioredoxin domain-containing protein 5 n=1 Tax=Drosophila elegans TaxID=30023 RepID=UPI0007E71239|nr:thioredoxin domain-containing protein 5 [Drosophila elegans]